jgi:hypothetical protein
MADPLLFEVEAPKKQPKVKRLNLKAALRSKEIEDAWEEAWTCSGLPAWAKEAYYELWSEAHAEICWLRAKKERTDYEKRMGLTGGTVSKFVGPKLNRILAYLKAHTPEGARYSKKVREMRGWCRDQMVRKSIDPYTAEVEGWCVVETIEHSEKVTVTDFKAVQSDVQDGIRAGIQDRVVLGSSGLALKAFKPKPTTTMDISWKSTAAAPLQDDCVILSLQDRLLAYWAGLKGLEILLADPELETKFFEQYLCWDPFDGYFKPMSGCKQWLEGLADIRLTQLILARLRTKLTAELPTNIVVFLGRKLEAEPTEGFQRWTGKIYTAGEVKKAVFTRRAQALPTPLGALLEPQRGLNLDVTSTDGALPAD